jgi:hypothetical protein
VILKLPKHLLLLVVIQLLLIGLRLQEAVAVLWRHRSFLQACCARWTLILSCCS